MAPKHKTFSDDPSLVHTAAASVFFEKELESKVVLEGTSVVLSCEVSSVTVPVTWRKDACLVTDGERFTLKKKGPVHTLEIRKLSLEDAGEYSCITRGKKTTAMLVVKGRPTPSYTLRKKFQKFFFPGCPHRRTLFGST